MDVRSNNTELADCGCKSRKLCGQSLGTCAGRIGCKLSHVKSLQLAMIEGARYVAIFEDDFEWTTEIDAADFYTSCDYVAGEVKRKVCDLVREIIDFEKSFPSWNVIGLSLHVEEATDSGKTTMFLRKQGNDHDSQGLSNKVLRIKRATKTHAYVVRASYIPRLINNFEACDVKSDC